MPINAINGTSGTFFLHYLLHWFSGKQRFRGSITYCWRRKWQPTPVFLPGKSHGQRRLVDYRPWG